MRTFLDELAERLLTRFSESTGELSVVFPNRRAGLFFIRALSKLISEPVWSPRIFSIEEFIYTLADREPSDRLTLVLELYKSYIETTGFEETFDRFYFWGDMLLNDFDEMDRYLTDADKIFHTVKSLKEIDATFPFLTEEQKAIIESFWGNLSDPKTEMKEGFIRFWKSLPAIYRSFHSRLKSKDMAYAGMIYRDTCSRIRENKLNWEGGKVIFAGFNALTLSESTILKWFVENGLGETIWDTDASYLENSWHEAGVFHRKYMNDPVFSHTFPKQLPDLIRNNKADIGVIATASGSSQAQWAGAKIRELRDSGLIGEPEKTVIVMPDESLVTQVLFALPPEIDKINITIAYPVRTVAMFSFFELVIELHENRKDSSSGSWFSHRQVLPLLAHPLLKAAAGERAGSLASAIQQKNRIYIKGEFLSGTGILSKIFRKISEDENVMDYLAGLVSDTIVSEERDPYNDEIRYYFYRLFNRIRDIFTTGEISLTFPLLRKLFRQLSRMERISFSGEPLEGIQVMGILETRNLDFENVIILSANEGVFPGRAWHNSFIPYNVRKAFGLPNYEHTGSIYAYLFYRLLQRSKRIWLVYNTEESGQSIGEPSRFIQQLKYEKGHSVNEEVMVQHVQIQPPVPLVINKDKNVTDILSRYTLERGGQVKHLTPSALNTYLDCPVSFYFRYVMGVKEKQEVSPDFNAVLFGIILHKVMEELYRPLTTGKGGIVEPEEIIELEKVLDDTIKKCFSMYFGIGENEEFRFEGRNILGKEIIQHLVKRILVIDREYAPFRILGLEQVMSCDIPAVIGGKKKNVSIKGIIDRIDEKDGQVRVIDYKSGKDSRQFESVEALFGPDENKRNKAAFQTLLYTMVLSDENKSDRIPLPCLYNAKELYQDGFVPFLRMGKGVNPSALNDAGRVEPLLEEYRQRFSDLIAGIFDADTPFAHRDEKLPCKFCDRAGFPS